MNAIVVYKLFRWLGASTLLMTLGMSPAAALPPYAAIVVDMKSGRLMHADNIHVRAQPASLTKIMTAFLTFTALERKAVRFDTLLPVSTHAANMEPSRLGLHPGNRISLRDALQATITKSANDAAVVLAEAIGGSEAQFARMMNTEAQRLGMLSTHFVNASGLPDRDQYTTARDMAVLARTLINQFPGYYPMFSLTHFQYEGVTHMTHNHLLRHYAGSDGIKTGYVRASGYNLVASAKRFGQRLIAVVLGGHSAYARDREIMSLLDTGFVTLARQQSRSVLASVNSAVTATKASGNLRSDISSMRR